MRSPGDPVSPSSLGVEEARAIRRRALRALLIMALASSPLIWVKLRLVTGIPRIAYAAGEGSREESRDQRTEIREVEAVEPMGLASAVGR